VTPIEAMTAIADALDCLRNWDTLVEALHEDADMLGIDASPLGQAVCVLDHRARLVLRQLEEEFVK
jgi:hypothetical protein